MLFIKHFLFGWWAYNVSEICFPLEMVIFHDCPVFEGVKTTNQPSIASVNDSLTQHVAH